MSGRSDREARREERQREDEQAEAAERRQRLVKLASAAGFLAVIVVAVLIVVSQSQTSGGDSSNIAGTAEVEQQLSGIPQEGMVLGEPSAKVTLVEFADLQCPVCKGYSEEILPQIIENQVRAGEAKLDFRSYTIIGAQSAPAGAAAIAAGEQGRGWNFVELFFRNQGIEDSGYVTDDFLTAIAKGAGVPDIAKWNADRKSRRVVNAVTAGSAKAEELGFTGTPSFAIEGPRTQGLDGTRPEGLEALGTPGSAADLEAAIKEAGA